MAANLLAFMVILTVEDEFLISEYLRTILEAHGHKVVATFDADAAIGALERRTISSLSSRISICRGPWMGCGWLRQSEKGGRRSI
jgi:DNA-binding response OmpR family regulator